MSQTPPPLPGDLPPAPPPLPGSAPPTVPGALGQSSGGWVTPYNFSNAFSKGLEVFRTSWPTLMGITLSLLGITIVFSLIQQGIVLLIPSWAGMVINYVFAFTASVLVTTPLISAAMVVVAERLRGRTGTGTGDMFALAFGPRYTKVVGAAIMLTLASYAIVLVIVAPMLVTGFLGGATITPGPGGGLQTQGVVWGIGMAVSVAFMIVGGLAMYYLLARFFAGTALILDPRIAPLTATDAFRASWNLTRAKGWSLLLLALVTAILAMLSVLLLCIGIVLIGYPLLLAVLGAAYAMIVHPLARRDLCTSCGFDLIANTTGTCPECGTFNPQIAGAAWMNRPA